MRKETFEMVYPNAYKGVKQILLAEILTIVSVILIVGGTILAVLGVGEESAVNALVGAGVLIAGAVVVVAAFLLQLIGVINGKKDEVNFRNALIFILLGIAISIAKSFAGESSGLYHGMEASTSFCSLFITYYILAAIESLAGKLNKEEVKALACKTRKLTCIAFSAAVLVELVATFIASPVVIAVLAVAAAVLKIVAYLLFLKALIKAKAMLA